MNLPVQNYLIAFNVFHIFNILSFSNQEITTDTPRPWGIYFQDSATPQMEGIEELHNNILFY